MPKQSPRKKGPKFIKTVRYGYGDVEIDFVNKPGTKRVIVRFRGRPLAEESYTQTPTEDMAEFYLNKYESALIRAGFGS